MFVYLAEIRRYLHFRAALTFNCCFLCVHYGSYGEKVYFFILLQLYNLFGKKFAHYNTNWFSFLILTPQELSEEK